MNARQLAGFSLMEMMVTLCLIAIVSGIAVVSLEPAWKKQRLKYASEDLRQRLQTLRLKSIVGEQTYQARIQDRCLFYRRYQKEDWSEWERITLNPSVNYSMNGTESFYSKGFASPKTIRLSNDRFNQRIVININGRIRVEQIN